MKLKEIREKLMLTQEEFAKAVGEPDENGLSQYELGTRQERA